MRYRILGPVIVCVGLLLVLLGSIWALGGYDELGVTTGWALTLGVGATMAVGIGFIAVILYGRRSRRDEAVHRATGDDDYE
jgi:hypothetical protein